MEDRVALSGAGVNGCHGRAPYPREQTLFPLRLPLGILFLLDEVVADGEYVHLGPQEALDSFFGPTDDGLILVKRSVEDNRTPVSP